MIQPLISIITVTYNSAATVRRTIESVKQQNYSNIEYIIVDGASADNTVEICKNALSDSNIKFTIISEPDNGIYDAMNKGIEIAKGDIIGIINSDDWYESNMFLDICNAWKVSGSGIYVGIMRSWLNNKEYLLERRSHLFLNTYMILHPATFITKDLYTKYGAYNTKYKYSADLDLILKYDAKKVNFYYIDKIISNFTIGGASSTSVAVLESLKVRLAYNLITKRQFFLKRLKLALKNVIGR